MTRAARPRTSSAGSGFFLFGMIDEPGRERVARADEPEPRVRPPRDLLGQTAQVDHPEGDRRERLDDEVAIADRVERVGRDPVEPELRGGRLAIERVARARERARAERRDVGPPPGVGQATAVALGHLDVREQVMGEQHGLCGLDVGRPGQHRGAFTLRQARRAPARTRAGPRPAGRSRAAATAAGRSRPGRCASARCAACRPRRRSGRPGRTRG